MRARSVLALAVVGASFATACTAYVASALNGLDDYKQGVTPGGGNKTGDPCSLVDDPDAANDCSACIATSCSDDVAYACNGGTQPKPWFQKLRSCAQNPFEGTNASFSWRCYPYDEPDAAVISGTDDSARERKSELCVRDSCLAGGNRAPAPCHTCLVTVEKPGSSSELARLEDSPCGACLADKCKKAIAACCGYGLPNGFAKCGYPQDPDFKRECASLSILDGGKGLADASCTGNEQCVSADCAGNGHCTTPNQTEQCDFDIRTCFKSCASQCQ